MLSNQGFDLWADGYDQSVQLSEDADTYPFAGYKRVLGTIYDTIRRAQGKRVLDVGVGTGVLSKKLYDQGYTIYGMDFSEKMLLIAQTKMPDACFLRHDFAGGFPEQWAGEQFDFIVCTYAIHHLDDVQKASFVHALLAHLSDGGSVLIGDVAFETRAELEACRAQCGEEWDEDEIYPVAQTLREAFPSMQFQKISMCAGILTFKRENKRA